MIEITKFNKALQKVIREHVTDYSYIADILCDILYENDDINKAVLLSKLNVEGLGEARKKYKDKEIVNIILEIYPDFKEVIEENVQEQVNEFAYHGCCYLIASLYKLEYNNAVEIYSNGIDKHCIALYKKNNQYYDYTLLNKYSFDETEYHPITSEEELKFMDNAISEFYGLYYGDKITDELRDNMQKDLKDIHEKIRIAVVECI